MFGNRICVCRVRQGIAAQKLYKIAVDCFCKLSSEIAQFLQVMDESSIRNYPLQPHYLLFCLFLTLRESLPSKLVFLPHFMPFGIPIERLPLCFLVLVLIVILLFSPLVDDNRILKL